jgi:hypothetical protein
MESYSNGTSIISRNGEIFVNGEKIKTPKFMNTNPIVNINGKIYIGGYKFFPKEKKFKRTIIAFLECYIF